MPRKHTLRIAGKQKDIFQWSVGEGGADSEPT